MRQNRDSPGLAPEPPLAEPGGNIVAWRRRLLVRAGFDEGLAARISAECGYDLHALVGLVELGCPPDLAARILAPLDCEENPC